MEFNSGDCYDSIVTKNYLNLMSTNLKKCEFLLLIFLCIKCGHQNSDWGYQFNLTEI